MKEAHATGVARMHADQHQSTWQRTACAALLARFALVDPHLLAFISIPTLSLHFKLLRKGLPLIGLQTSSFVAFLG